MKYNEFEHNIGDLVFHMSCKGGRSPVLGVVVEKESTKYTVRWVTGDVSFHGFEYLFPYTEASHETR